MTQERMRKISRRLAFANICLALTLWWGGDFFLGSVELGICIFAAYAAIKG